MTTIACNRETMAADSKVSLDDTSYPAKKIVRVGHSLVGAAGYGCYAVQFIDMMKRGELKPLVRRPSDADAEGLDFVGMVLTKEGIFIYDEDMAVDKVEADFFAIGTGGQAARAAMILGADPVQAVKVATLVDNASGLPVISWKLTRSRKAST